MTKQQKIIQQQLKKEPRVMVSFRVPVGLKKRLRDTCKSFEYKQNDFVKTVLEIAIKNHEPNKVRGK